jgi:hypothetical protein
MFETDEHSIGEIQKITEKFKQEAKELSPENFRTYILGSKYDLIDYIEEDFQ